MNRATISLAQIQDTMSRLAYFEDWEKEKLARFSACGKQFSLTKKSCLVAKGATIECLYVVVSGQVKLFIPLPNGTERVIALVGRGESFGEPCLIINEPCPYEVVATKDSHILAFDALIYRNELKHNPRMVERMLNLLSKRLLYTLRDIEICAQPSSLQRVARYLMQHRPEGDNPAFEIRLPGLKRDIAAQLGLTQETFSRMLGFMAQQGLIEVRGGKVGVEDGGRLRHLIESGCPMASSNGISPK